MIYSFRLATRDYFSLLVLVPDRSEARDAFYRADKTMSGRYFRILCGERALADILTAAFDVSEELATDILGQLRAK